MKSGVYIENINTELLLRGAHQGRQCGRPGMSSQMMG